MNGDFDTVIIGSGVSGALCAWRLAAAGQRVAILEAGPRINRSDVAATFSTTHKHDYSWGYPNLPSAPRPDWSGADDAYITYNGPDRIPFEYLRVVGGTTWHWAAACSRFLPSDFHANSTYGVGLDWPLRYDHIEPYYQLAERELGVAGDDSADTGSPRSAPYPMPALPLTYGERIIAERLRAMGVSTLPQPCARNTIGYDNRPQCDGHGTCVTMCPTGAQYSAIVHVERAERLGARVYEQCRVDRLNVADDGHISSVLCTLSDGTTQTISGRTFILAANAVESPRLLLASSNERYPNGLANSSGLVGRNFMSHYAVHNRMQIDEPVYFGRGPHHTTYIGDYRDLPTRRIRSAAFVNVENVVEMFPSTIEIIDEKIFPPDLDTAIRQHAIRETNFIAFVETLPRPDNRVAIDWDRRDSAGQPRIKIHFALSDYERSGMEWIRGTLGTYATTLKARWSREWRNIATNHLAGTLRMGTNSHSSVVDTDGRTHDHSNLFVVGASTFPTQPACAPTLSIAAFALHTAEKMLANPPSSQK